MEATVIAVVGASGGVGCSTAAAHLAGRFPSGRVCLLDAESRTGAIDVTAGLEHVPGPRWGDFEGLRGRADGLAILQALPSSSRYAVLAGGRGGAPPEVVEAVLAGLRDACDLVVLDVGRLSGLPPGILRADDLGLVLTGLGVRHLADLDRIVDDLELLPAPFQLVTRGAKGLALLGQVVSTHVGLPVLGHWADDAGVPRDLERGIAPGARSRGFDRLADAALTAVRPALGRSA